ncbi:FMN-binding glutamate synthase family protein [Iodidimonas gelatinilytica]|uniref:FMN-binding glutamate synthase family protein n=1 Tax=Iodidimonas gelatinilytica TaxID=1236966 RepID=A0A5A7MR77_9PROT|nr:FMN-binding glutamate synthase family protein [Iodidimonas gelatinilytica]GEQ98316.1 FMN-binding glutamate synthase family protein [Iodidimonas gelatinilytica]
MAAPYLREYLFIADDEGRPFSHDERALVYQRSKNIEALQAFGTKMDLYSPSYEWINHAINAKHPDPDCFRVNIGGEACKKPYSASLLNISAMSFGSLGAHAIEALNLGAKMGEFYHDTGEGGLSPYHQKHGGDLVWEIGTGYFGCRTKDGHFDPHAFAEKAQNDQVKMIEVKLNQGAKPGHGGVLPGPKVTPEIAQTRGVEPWKEVISPPSHTAFDTPKSMMHWLAQLRDLSGGKPVGFKLCLGHRWEFLALTKAMLETGIAPDFIVVDGAEGGTGAAPIELSDHVGTPLREGLVFVVNTLIGTGLRDKIRIGVAGKITNGHMMAANLALGADWCNAARGFMFSLGCVQTRKCHTDRCPTGIATQNHWRQAGLVVADKGPRCYQFHKNTIHALAHYVASAGLDHPSQLRPHHLRVRVSENLVNSADKIYDFIAPNSLLHAPKDTPYARWWSMADANSFAPCC